MPSARHSNRASRSADSFGFIASLLLAAAALMPLSGCAAGGVGAELTAHPAPHAIGKANHLSLSLPADEMFSIALAPTSQAPGLDGTAEGHASADKKGAATANAKVGKVGTASGTFQLGHAFRNDSGGQLDLDFRIAAAYEYHVSSEPPKAGASVGLNLFARDGRGRLLRTFPLVSLTSNDGAAGSRDQRDVQFTVTLGPGDELSVFAAGNASAECRPSQNAEASLSLSSFKMDVAGKVAPAVRSAPASAPSSTAPVGHP